MKAIETKYKGYRFRSRLEARWAVFFDALGIRWEYEHEGFELLDGTRYLPDFWLPEFNDREHGLFVEVKPEEKGLEKAWKFAEQSGRKILLAIGVPEARAYFVENEGVASFNRKYLPGGSNASEYRMYGCPAENEPGEDRDVIAAAVRAKSARFEFGAHG